ncbi:hypothetical protein ACFL59_06570 [Planctomycetota bacterium]
MPHVTSRVAAPLLAVLALWALPSALAMGAEPRWSIPEDGCLVYEIRGPEATELFSVGAPSRTLYAADLKDGRTLSEPVGCLPELMFHYLFQLPKEEVKGQTTWDVAERHRKIPPPLGPLRVQGRGVAKKKGRSLAIGWELTIHRDVGQPTGQTFLGGTLRANSLFHKKKGVILQAEFDLTYTTERDGVTEEKVIQGQLALKEQVAIGISKQQKQVDKAVNRARSQILVPYLSRKPYQRLKGQALGNLALVLYAALQAGLKKDESLAKQGFEDLTTMPLKETYSVALAILALEARSLRRIPEPHGKGRATRPRIEKEEVLGSDKTHLERMTRWLLEARTPGRGMWSYLSHAAKQKRRHGDGDHSNTQFAILALNAAARSGVDIPAAVWKEIAEHFLHVQGSGPRHAPELTFEQGAPFAPQPSGSEEGATAPRERSRNPRTARERANRARGFDYRDGQRPYASMSAAGVSSLAICYNWLSKDPACDPQLLAKIRRAVLNGLAWHDLYHTMRRNWPNRRWPYYHLYSLEKLFEITRVETISGHDWWAEGAQELLLREEPRGGWHKGRHVETALAVLFLTRATAEPAISIREITRKTTGSGSAEETDEVLVEGVGLLSAGEVAAACDVANGALRQERLELLERVFAAMDPERRPLLVPPLAKHLTSRHKDLRRVSRTLIHEALGLRVKDAEEALSLHSRWVEIVNHGRTGDPESIAPLRARLSAERAQTLKNAAVLALSRLRAVEAVPDIIDQLEGRDPDYRSLCHSVLVSLTGEDPGYTPRATGAERRTEIERWRLLWNREKERLLRSVDLARLISALALKERREASAARLLGYGEEAVPVLIAALGTPTSRGNANRRDQEIADILAELTGVDYGRDRKAWEAWWRRRGLRRQHIAR